MLTKVTKEMLEDAADFESKNIDSNVDVLKTLYKDFDDKLGGLRRGELYLFAGEADAGKTSFFINLINTVGVIQDKTVAYFSMEDGIGLSFSKLLKVANYSDNSEFEGYIPENDISVLSQKNIYIDDTPGQEIKEIEEALSKINKSFDLILVDYLQLMSGYDSDSNKAEILKGLKGIAKEYNCPVLSSYTVSSISSSIDMGGRYPEVREMNQAAREIADNIILFTFKESVFENDGNGFVFKYFSIVKCRNGSTGQVILIWEPKYLKYLDYKDSSSWRLNRYVKNNRA